MEVKESDKVRRVVAGVDQPAKGKSVRGYAGKDKYPLHPLPKKLALQIENILIQNRGYSTNNTKVGFRTDKKRRSVVKGFFIDLLKLGFKIEGLHNLSEKHLRAVFKFQEDKGLEPSTIVNKISVMRIFCGWIGKNGMVRNTRNYVTEKEIVQSSSFEMTADSLGGETINVTAKINEIARLDKPVAIELELCFAFGLQIWEAISLKPAVQDGENFVSISDGNGTGRRRSKRVQIKGVVQRDVITRAKAISDETSGFLGNRKRNETQRKSHFYYVMRKCGITLSQGGITAKGLRNQYLKDRSDRLGEMEEGLVVRTIDCNRISPEKIKRVASILGLSDRDETQVLVRLIDEFLLKNEDGCQST